MPGTGTAVPLSSAAAITAMAVRVPARRAVPAARSMPGTPASGWAAAQSCSSAGSSAASRAAPRWPVRQPSAYWVAAACRTCRSSACQYRAAWPDGWPPL